MCLSIHYCYVDRNWATVVLILQLSANKPLQEKNLQCDDIIKKKYQSNLKRRKLNMAFMFVHVLI